MESRTVYFIQHTECDEQGWIPCIAKEGDPGFYRTNWHWDCTFEEAESICDEKNELLGISQKEAIKIVLSTMALV